MVTERHLRLVPTLRSQSQAERRLIPEPADGSVVRFVKSGYWYVAIRCGRHWETSATSLGEGFIDQVMSWNQLWDSGRYFELATDKRLAERSVVLLFTIADKRVAAVGVQGAYRGFNNRLWYTTLTDAASRSAKIACYTTWADIARSCQQVEVVTSWTPLIPLRDAQDTAAEGSQDQDSGNGRGGGVTK